MVKPHGGKHTGGGWALATAAACLLVALTGYARDEQTELQDALERYLESCSALGWSGVAYVERGGEVLLNRGFGFADRKRKREHQPETLFEIASATKPFTACAILALVEEGRLALDDSIADHLPGVPEDKRTITVAQLLSHTAGMPRSAAGGYGSDLEVAVAGYLATPSARAPGSGHEYWNGGYALLAGIIETVSGKSYQDYCRERLFERAGLEATGFTGDTHLPSKRLAIGYNGEEALRPATGHPYRDYGYQYRGMGGLVTCVPDLVRFTRALEAGRVLSKDSVEAMQSNVAEYYGLGWGLSTTRRNTRRIGHGGSVAGFHTQWQRFPDEDAMVIVLSNVDGVPVVHLAWNLEAMLFGDPMAYPAPPEVVSVKKAELDKLEGRYALEDGNAIRVQRDGNQLKVEVLDLDPSALEQGKVPDRLEPLAEKARGILQAVRDGDAPAIEKVLGPNIPSSWPRMLVTRIWTKHLDQWGALKAVVTLAAEDLGGGAVQTRFRLEHQGGARPLKIVLRDEKLAIFDLAGPLDSLAGTYVPLADGTFQNFVWGSPFPCSLRFEQQGRQVLSLTAQGRGALPRKLKRVD